ncbi:MAG: NYN domain-containing protein [Xanthobacteraceae bacterium]|nr:NYN domain-containing protein [Xanthobacteraceae bacterium]
MAFKDTIRVVQSGQRRMKIFVDFWNVVINARSQCKNFDVHIHWDKLVENAVHNTRQGYLDETVGELAGCYIFGSKSQSNPEDTKFVNRVLDQYGSQSGLFFHFAERVPKQTSTTCSKCGEQVRMNSESGVDVLLAVEMIKHATMREHEYLALVSSDRDFIPLLSFLRDQGQRVLHVAAGSPDRDMRAITWSQMNLRELYTAICTIEHDDYIVLTAPSCNRELEQLIDAAPVERNQMRVIDITDKHQIHDKDLLFLVSSLHLHWSTNRDPSTQFAYRRITSDLHEFRRRVADGSLRGSLPCVIGNGRIQIQFNGTNNTNRWIRMVYAGDEPGLNDSWAKLFSQG